MRKKGKGIAVLSVLFFFVLIASFVMLYFGKEKLDEYKAVLQSLNIELNNNKRIVYVAACEIVQGSIIDENMLREKEIYTELGVESFFNKDMIGFEALVNIPVNEPVMANMATEFIVSDEEKEYEVSTVEIMADQADYDYVDIRIMFPDGSDYLVVPHKKIYSLNCETATFNIHCTESEILTMTSAIIDTYITLGARMYTVRYINGSLQESGIPNYPVKEETIALINSDPNVVYRAVETLNYTARTALEEKLQSLSEEELSAVEGGNAND